MFSYSVFQFPGIIIWIEEMRVNVLVTFCIIVLAFGENIAINNQDHDETLDKVDAVLEHMDDGGWNYSPESSALAGPCTIDFWEAENLSQDDFLMKYAYTAPVVINGATDLKTFRELTRKSSLLSLLGGSTVRLSSANTYSYDKKDVSFQTYCDDHMEPQDINSLANETYYLFGDHTHTEWLTLLDQYPLPPYTLPRHSPMLSFGVAGPGSGVPFHFHGPGFAETVWGRKRWFLSPPDSVPLFNPNRTTLQWLQEHPPTPGLLECTISPGQLVYFPDRWWHATLNVDAAVFVSTFLSP